MRKGKGIRNAFGQEYLVEQIRKTGHAKKIYIQRKETIERVFTDVKEKHAMRYTYHRGLATVTRWGRLEYVVMNLKKLAMGVEIALFYLNMPEPLFLFNKNRGSLTASGDCIQAVACDSKNFAVVVDLPVKASFRGFVSCQITDGFGFLLLGEIFQNPER